MIADNTATRVTIPGPERSIVVSKREFRADCGGRRTTGSGNRRGEPDHRTEGKTVLPAVGYLPGTINAAGGV
jgi:hypothetical protein